MNDLSNYNSQQSADNFARSENWRWFQVQFAANFYELKPDQASYAAWFQFAMDCTSRIELLIQALDIAAQDGEIKRPTLPKIKRIYFDLLRQEKAKYTNDSDCSICNNTRIVHNCEAEINGNITLLDPFTPQPCRAYATVADCICAGGEQAHTDKRFLPPMHEGHKLIGCEHISQRQFIYDCYELIKRSSK